MHVFRPPPSLNLYRRQPRVIRDLFDARSDSGYNSASSSDTWSHVNAGNYLLVSRGSDNHGRNRRHNGDVLSRSTYRVVLRDYREHPSRRERRLFSRCTHSIPDFDEGSDISVEVEFFDLDGVAAIPTAVQYRLDDSLSGEVIRAKTSVTPASSVTIAITDTEMAIVNDERVQEEHVLTVKASYGANQARIQQYRFLVNNLKFADFS